MAYDEGLAQRVSEILIDLPNLDEKKMFGGIGYMLNGNIAVGVHGDSLIVRTGPEMHGEARQKPHTKEFDITGRPMKGWIMVSPEGVQEDESLQTWVQMGIDFAISLPAK